MSALASVRDATRARWLAARRWGGRGRRLRAIGIPPLLTSIRIRLTLWYVAILAVVLLVFGGVVYGAQSRSIDAEARDQLRTLSQQLAATYDPSDGVLHPELIFEKGGKLAGGPDTGLVPSSPPKGFPVLGQESFVLFFDREGRLIQRLGRDIEASISPQLQKQLIVPQSASDPFSLVTVSDQAAGGSVSQYRCYVSTVMFKTTSVGTVLVGQPDETAARLRELRLTLLLATPATLLLAAGGGYWLAARAMRPVRLIGRAAQEIGATDLGRRLRLPGRDELGELAATFDRMLDRLEAAFARQRQFTADASHELRTPLTIVDLEVTRALAGPRSPEEYARALATIQVENARMARLVNDLLVLARADAGRTTLRCEALDLSDLALEVVERLGPLACKGGVALTTGNLPDLPIAGDRLYLAQLLTNLVENGIVYTSGYGTRVCVETGQCQVADRVPHAWVRVSDDGPGIAAGHLPFLFDRFYRADQARGRDEARDGAGAGVPGGSGLGLAIVRWVAEAHGGEVSVRSTPGAGTTFEVRLPLV